MKKNLADALVEATRLWWDEIRTCGLIIGSTTTYDDYTTNCVRGHFTQACPQIYAEYFSVTNFENKGDFLENFPKIYRCIVYSPKTLNALCVSVCVISVTLNPIIPIVAYTNR